MSPVLKGLKGSGTFKRGIHPPERKHFSGSSRIKIIPCPEKVLIPLQQNIGSPCMPTVQWKQEVNFGERIAVGEGFISASIHSPIAGKIQKETMATLPNGRHVKALPIKASGDQIDGETLWNDLFGGTWPKKFNGEYSPEKISEKIKEAGIVGLGGAAFPTHVKILYNPDKQIDTLLVNGCECEPYLTTDYRLMIDAPEPIITGTLLAKIATRAETAIVCIEDNKPEAVESMKNAAKGTGIKVAVLKTKYPQGSERHMIKAVLNRIVPLGYLPSDVSTAVSNVATIISVAQAVIRNKPLTHRIVCVTGGGINNPSNILAPIGISYRELIDYAGGMKNNTARIVSGGPMMGFAFSDLDMPITKGTSGVTLLTDEEIKRGKETACLRCGRCVDVCPMCLVPARLALAARHRNVEMAEKYNIMGCLETGCCAYICPANIPLVQMIRLGKAMVMANIKNIKK